jgi:hypothetical protein
VVNGCLSSAPRHVTESIGKKKKKKRDHLPLETEAGTGEDGITEVPAKGAQRVLLHHAADGTQLLPGLGVVDAGNEGQALAQGEVGPVDALGGVGVIGSEEVGEDGLLVLGRVLVGEGGGLVTRLGAVGDADDARVGGIVVSFAVEEVSHGCR